MIWRILEKYNQDPAEVFRKVQLDPDLMHQPGARYSLQKVNELWEELNRRIEDSCLGLAAAKCWHPSYFGEVHEEKDKGAFVFTLRYIDEHPYPHSHEIASLALIMSVLRMNYHQDFLPLSVHLTHSRPDCAAKYYEFFQSPIIFDAPACRLNMPLDEVDSILPSPY